MKNQAISRNRAVYATIAGVILGSGLMSRSPSLPDFLQTYSGDTLWAMLVFFLAATIFRGAKTRTLALVTLLFSWLIEISQFYQAPWIDAIRATTMGGLILGFGFLWSDLICYTAGTMLACATDRIAIKILNSQGRL